MKASDINPSDIPSEDILRQMGLSVEEISEAMDYKYQRGSTILIILTQLVLRLIYSNHNCFTTQ